MLLWHYSFHRLSTKQMRAVRGVSTIISRGARSILQIQQYYYVVQTMYSRVCILTENSWLALDIQRMANTHHLLEQRYKYSVFGRCAERYVLQVLYLTSQYLCTAIGKYIADKQCCDISTHDAAAAWVHNFRNIIHTQIGFFYACCHGSMHTFFSLFFIQYYTCCCGSIYRNIPFRWLKLHTFFWLTPIFIRHTTHEE